MKTPEPFDLALTVRSHGWYDLAPWRWDEARGMLSRPVELSSGRVAVVEVVSGARACPRTSFAPRSGAGEGGLAFRALARGRLGAAEAREARAALETCLSLDDSASGRRRSSGSARRGAATSPTCAGPSRAARGASSARRPCSRTR